MFHKIVTVTMNPAIDATIWLPGLDLDEPNVAIREESYAGGKGVNVSRVLRSYGMEEVVTTGICGEENYLFFLKLLGSDGVTGNFALCEGATRENLSLITPDNKMLKVNRQGAMVSDNALAVLRAKILLERSEGEETLAVFAGSIPKNLTAKAYQEFILDIKQAGIPVVLDTSVFGLAELREIKPFAIKPNLPEFEKICGVPLKDEETLLSYAGKLSEDISYVLVSLGEKGLLCCYEGKAVQALPPSVEVKSTVAAGDTTLASFLYALHHGEELSAAAAFAAAAGTASVMLEGTAVVAKEDVLKVLERTAVKEL